MLKALRLSFSKLIALRLTSMVIAFAIFNTGNAVRSQTGSEGAGVLGIDVNTATEMLDLNSVELRIQLQNGLRVFLPEQQEFLDRVILAVDSGQIPRAMVNMVYLWSQRRNRKIPFPYFEFAMRSLAERRGVIL